MWRRVMYRRASGVSWCRHARWADTTEELSQRGKENSKQAICGMNGGAALRIWQITACASTLLYCCNEREREERRRARYRSIDTSLSLSPDTLLFSTTTVYTSSLLVLLDYPTIFKFIHCTPQIKTIFIYLYEDLIIDHYWASRVQYRVICAVSWLGC